jgi:ADP-heptose:LPS heptosyltransferase
MKINIIRSLVRWYLKGKSLSRAKIEMKDVSNILVMSNTAIGDTLFATPAINLLRKNYPDKNIIALLNPKNYELFKTNPNIDEIITYRGKWGNFLQVAFKLRAKNIDLTFIFHSNEPQATPLAFLSGSKYIIKIPNDKNEFNFLHYNPPIAPQLDEHFINRRLKQLSYIGIDEQSYQMEIYPLTSWYSEVDKVLKDNVKYIGIQIGASTISRMWLIERWIDLVNRLLDYDINLQVVLTGSESDRQLTDKVENSIQNQRVLNMAGVLDLCSAAALIDRLDLLITPDTGPLHIAAAVKTPTITISVAGNSVESNPIDKEIPHVFIQKPITCSPCIDKRCKNATCMEQISTEEVLSTIIQILKII